MSAKNRLHIIVAQYLLVGHVRRTAHWCLAVLESRSSATIFELAGNSDSFQFIRRPDYDFSRSLNLRGGCHVGYILPSQLDWLERRLREDVGITRGNLDWDCQSWVVDALRLLKLEDQGNICIDFRSGAQIRDDLAADWERWEAGDDTVNERLFPL